MGGQLGMPGLVRLLLVVSCARALQGAPRPLLARSRSVAWQTQAAAASAAGPRDECVSERHVGGGSTDVVVSRARALRALLLGATCAAASRGRPTRAESDDRPSSSAAPASRSVERAAEPAEPTTPPDSEEDQEEGEAAAPRPRAAAAPPPAGACRTACLGKCIQEYGTSFVPGTERDIRIYCESRCVETCVVGIPPLGLGTRTSGWWWRAAANGYDSGVQSELPSDSDSDVGVESGA